MKLISIFLGVFPLQIVCMDKPLAPRVKPAAVASKVKAAASVWPPKPAAAGSLAKKSAANLKRSSDEEDGEGKPFQRRRRRSIAALDTIIADATKLVPKPSAQPLIDEVKQQVREGMLKIISTNPPVCEVIRQKLPWRCRQGCRAEFIDQEAERRHIHLAHNIVAASNEDMLGIDWEAIGTLVDVRQSHTPPVPEEEQDEGEVEEIT